MQWREPSTFGEAAYIYIGFNQFYSGVCDGEAHFVNRQVAAPYDTTAQKWQDPFQIHLILTLT
jgi:hypothetical protein